MKYDEALTIGRRRAEEAAAAIQRWTGVRAFALFTVKPGWRKGSWKPVGRMSRKEICWDDGFRGGGGYYIAVVDGGGAVKACSKQLYPLGEALKLAERIPMGVACPGRGELWQRLDEEDARARAGERALHVEV
ncbi:MAG: hypothetical protein Q8Q12_15050 [bacterium]|nr:hypothetical protein [bacterium]